MLFVVVDGMVDDWLTCCVDGLVDLSTYLGVVLLGHWSTCSVVVEVDDCLTYYDVGLVGWSTCFDVVAVDDWSTYCCGFSKDGCIVAVDFLGGDVPRKD